MKHDNHSVEIPFPSGCILINARPMTLIQAVH